MLALFCLAGCRPGSTVASAVRTDAATARDVIEDEVVCRDASGYAEPLIVDWSSAGRLDLEAAMTSGVAVVSYDCHRLRLLNGCTVDGDYAFVGVTVKEETIQLTNADEVQANLPLSGVKLSASMDAKSSLDLALVMVGKRSTTLREANRSRLQGSCDGATHFVRAATVGAFAMARGSSGEVRAAVDLFGAGAGAASEESRNNRTVDGDRNACKKSAPGDDAPPAGCGAALRLELIPIVQGELAEAPAEPKETKPTVREVCPEGMVKLGGKCAIATAQDKLCDQGNRPACQALCAKGSARGCFEYAQAIAFGTWRRPAEEKKAILEESLTFMAKACELGSQDACYEQAWMHWNQYAYGPVHDPKRALELAEASCAQGGGRACGLIASAHDPKSHDAEKVTPDAATWERYVTRACDLGEDSWCATLAARLTADPKTRDKGLAVFRRACTGTRQTSCRAWAEAVDPKREEAEAIDAYVMACLAGWSTGCARAGKHLSRGELRDPARGAAMARRGCFDLSDPRSCKVIVDWPDYRELEPDDQARAARYGCAHDWQGLYASLCAEASYHTEKRSRDLDLKACDEGDAPACARLAEEQIRLACKGGVARSCRKLETRDPVRYEQYVRAHCDRNPKSQWCEVVRAKGWPLPKSR